MNSSALNQTGGDSAGEPNVVAATVWRIGSRETVTLAAALVAVVVVCLLGFHSHPRLDDRALRAAIEMTITLTGALASGLLVVQVRARRLRRDVLLLGALLLVALADLLFSALPGITGVRGLPFGFDARLAVSALVPIAFLAAALARTGWRHRAGQRRTALIPAGCLVVVAAVEVCDLLTHRYGSGTGVGSGTDGALMIGEAAVFLIAAGAFVTVGDHGERGVWLAAACVTLAGARVLTIAMPSPDLAWVTLSQPLRVAAYGLIGAAVTMNWLELLLERQEDSVRAERERIANDLHDGLSQDLATIMLHVGSLAGQFDEDHPLMVATRRAMAASRETLVNLSAREAPTTLAALRSVADDLEARFAIEVTVRGAAGERQQADLTPRAREQAVRIAREAIINAARHGGARHVEVALRTETARWSLSITDDGIGLPDAVTGGRSAGFGMGAMRARARELGGEFTARRLPVGGTRVEVLVPEPVRSAAR